MNLLTREQAVARYGNPLPAWPGVLKWCSIVQVPPELAPTLINTMTKKPTQHIYCNNDMAPMLLEALKNVVSRGLVQYLQTFDGCFMPRDVRAEPGLFSWHALALAIDFNAATNPLGAVGDMPSAIVACFKDAGFVWGGDFSRRLDMQHFQAGIG